MTLNPNWFLNATGQFTPIGSGQIAISTTTTTGFLTYLTASLSTATLVAGDATTGPSVAQGSSGTWYATGVASFVDTAAARSVSTKLSDGTTIIASSVTVTFGAAAINSIALSGIITAPAGNIRLIAATGTTGTLTMISTSNLIVPQTNMSTLTVIRIA